MQLVAYILFVVIKTNNSTQKYIYNENATYVVGRLYHQ